MVKRVPGPDGLEKGMRLGCGAVLGALIVGPLAVRLGDPPPAGVWLSFGLGVAAFALLAVRYGDRFWGWFASWGRWWPW